MVKYYGTRTNNDGSERDFEIEHYSFILEHNYPLVENGTNFLDIPAQNVLAISIKFIIVITELHYSIQ